MSKPCTVRVDTSKSVPTIYLEGEITTFSDKEINDAFHALPKDSSYIVLDFAHVKYINSAGIAILVSLVTETEKNGGKLFFSGLVPHYRRVMEIVGIAEYVEVFDTVHDALAAAERKT